jgi:hypothetical protein
MQAKAHREAVWLAIGAAAVVGGITAATSAWLYSAPQPGANGSGLWACSAATGVFVGGAVVVLLGGLVLLGFFTPWIWLPRTTAERKAGFPTFREWVRERWAVRQQKAAEPSAKGAEGATLLGNPGV